MSYLNGFAFPFHLSVISIENIEQLGKIRLYVKDV